jgi:AcrR family transcriptional regulator
VASPKRKVPQTESHRHNARERLRAAAVDFVANHGVREHSLREIATALGTSHRMLIYHFGSRQGLFVEIIRVMEQQQLQALQAMVADIEASASTSDVMRRFWRRLADPAIWPQERLFFEVYGQALQGEPHAVPLLDGIVDSWVDPAAAHGELQGLPPRLARANARLGLAVVRGLLLDLLATGDTQGVDDAMERFIHIAAMN